MSQSPPASWAPGLRLDGRRGFRFARARLGADRQRLGGDARGLLAVLGDLLAGVAQFLAIDGAKRLGEIALVDAGSPIFQSGRVFYEILFDENAACHIAFGEAYPECVEGGTALSRDELAALGVNQAETHVDFMIGTPTMQVTGVCADGRRIPMMENGCFCDELR